MAIEIESGDIILIKREFNKSTKANDKYIFGHVEIGVADPDLPNTITMWPMGEQLTDTLNTRSEAHVFRSSANKEDRGLIYSITDWMRGSRGVPGATNVPENGIKWDIRTGLSPFRRLAGNSDERIIKYWDRIVQTTNGTYTGPIVRRVFCSESAVIATQLAAMAAVEGGLSFDAMLNKAKRSPLFMHLNAKATTPDNLYMYLRSSPNWKFVGDYMHDADQEKQFDSPLACAVRLALSHYKRRWSIFSNKSRESDVAVINLGLLTSLKGVDDCGDDELRWYLKEILGVFPALGYRVKPMSRETASLLRVLKLRTNSRLRDCLINALQQMNIPQFTFA